MERASYALAAEVENTHWWFRGRREILRAAIVRALAGAPRPAHLLEAGCGNGGNLPLLAEFGRVSAFELDDVARERAVARRMAVVARGSLPDDIPFAPGEFDLVAALDVVEHVDDDRAAILGLAARVRPGGCLLLTVPAFRWLWSEHDDITHHRRRYTAAEIKALFRGAGLATEHLSYFNTLLFPLAAAHIKLRRLLRLDPYSAFRTPPRWQNEVLASVFALERGLAPRFRLPFGISLLGWARKPAA
ncbi:MAG: class I SAM-dependent methyltransferase [Burkholderiales bacterium]|nr:class I SAM-dependent methyltransferase [Burkholderiales bacterium]